MSMQFARGFGEKLLNSSGDFFALPNLSTCSISESTWMTSQYSSEKREGNNSQLN